MYLQKIRGRSKRKKAQGIMSLPFGIIFSIFLIIIFIAVAFVVIKNWLSLQKCTQVVTFYDDLQSKVNEAYSGTGYKDWMAISLPSGIKEVCFADLSKPQIGRFKEEYGELSDKFESYDANTFPYPGNDACENEYKLINHLDIPNIIKTQNPYCISTAKKIEVSFEIYGKGVVLREKA